MKLLRTAAWAPLSVLFVHWMASRIFGHEPWVDPIMHFLGGAAIAYVVLRWAPLAAKQLGELRPLGRDLLAFGMACTAAVLWEAGEFASDMLLRTHVQLGRVNTMRDLVLGVAGGLVVVAMARAMRRVSR